MYLNFKIYLQGTAGRQPFHIVRVNAQGLVQTLKSLREFAGLEESNAIGHGLHGPLVSLLLS